MDNREKKYWVALQTGLMDRMFPIVQRLIRHYGSLEEFWKSRDMVRLSGITDTVRERLIVLRKKTDPDRLWEICCQKKVNVLCCLDEDYPKELLHFSDCPVILYYYGKKELLNKTAAAVVGSRKSTAYGRKMAADFSKAFSAAGWCIVSGMAKGIDAAAHGGALGAKGDTVAVLGCGTDIPYPIENENLYWRIRENGLVVSEYFPGEKPVAWRFPLRNRIISGLSRFVLIVEGEARSGALITCNWAAEQGKDVWALPGPVTNPYSIGPLQLIRDGALVAITPEGILQNYDPGSIHYRIGRGESEAAAYTKADHRRPGGGRDNDTGQQVLPLSDMGAMASLSENERKLYEAISYYPVHVNGLLTGCFISAQQEQKGRANLEGDLYLGLTKLISLRLIEKLPGDYYQRV